MATHLAKSTSRAAPQRERVRELWADGTGLTVREIAAVLHISTQRVYQHLAAINGSQEPEEATA